MFGPEGRVRHKILSARLFHFFAKLWDLTCKLQLAYSAVMSDVYEALAVSTRRTILDALHEKDGQTLFELCSRLAMKHGLGLSRQAISQHLDVLELAGLVTTKREGRYKFHYIDVTPLKSISERWPTRK